MSNPLFVISTIGRNLNDISMERRLDASLSKQQMGFGAVSDALLEERQEMQSLFFKLQMDQREALLQFMRSLTTLKRVMHKDEGV
ncbi:MAG: hypothetical protein MK510_13800 [SAR324 cluster bacterium]|nr:hypothetical protein [SAR324 cluster bacterium]